MWEVRKLVTRVGEEVASLDKRVFQKLNFKVYIPCSFAWDIQCNFHPQSPSLTTSLLTIPV